MTKRINNGDNNVKQRGDAKMPGGITGKGFRPGQSGNPKSRPPSRGLSARLRAELAQTVQGNVLAEEMLAKKLVRLALGGDLGAIRECFDRTEGKPKQQVDLNDITKQFQGRTDEELLYYAEHGKWPERIANA